MKIEIEKHPNGSIKSISFGSGILSTLFWGAVLLFLVLPVFAGIGAVFGVILLVAKVAEMIQNAWWDLGRRFRKPPNWEATRTSQGRARR